MEQLFILFYTRFIEEIKFEGGISRKRIFVLLHLPFLRKSNEISNDNLTFLILMMMLWESLSLN